MEMKRQVSKKQLDDINSLLDEEIISVKDRSARQSWCSRGNKSAAGFSDGSERLPMSSEVAKRKLSELESRVNHQSYSTFTPSIVVQSNNTDLKNIMDKLNKLEAGLSKVASNKPKSKAKERPKRQASPKSNFNSTSGISHIPINSSRYEEDISKYNNEPIGHFIMPPQPASATRKLLDEQIKKNLDERAKVRDLKALNLELKTKIKKLSVKVSGYTNLLDDYKTLQQNFEKSEAIRIEQEKLIKKLKKQLKGIDK